MQYLDKLLSQETENIGNLFWALSSFLIPHLALLLSLYLLFVYTVSRLSRRSMLSSFLSFSRQQHPWDAFTPCSFIAQQQHYWSSC